MNILTESALPRAREFLAISALSLGAFAMAMNANVLAPLMPFLAEDPIYRGMAAEELAAKVQDVAQEIGYQGPADTGRFMKEWMARHKGLAEGRDVQAALKAL